MINLENYLQDGANYQAKAVLAFLQVIANIDESWNKEAQRYEAEIKVSRWENFREQGYVVSLRSRDYKRQLNIIFFEHRNSDSICAVKWEQITTNAPNIDIAEFGNVYKDKYDTSHSVGYGKVSEMAEWIAEELKKFWILTTQN